MIRGPFAIASAIRYRPQETERNPQYLRFIRTFPCVGCGATRWVEAMHIGPHGLGQKASDLDALPGCRACHRTGPQALYRVGPRDFQVLRGISFPELIQHFRHLWEMRGQA